MDLLLSHSRPRIRDNDNNNRFHSRAKSNHSGHLVHDSAPSTFEPAPSQATTDEPVGLPVTRGSYVNGVATSGQNTTFTTSTSANSAGDQLPNPASHTENNIGSNQTKNNATRSTLSRKAKARSSHAGSKNSQQNSASGPRVIACTATNNNPETLPIHTNNQCNI